MNELVFQGANEQALTNSLLVAEKFGKRHADVIRAIEDLITQLPENEHERNFALMYNNVLIGNGATRKDKVYASVS